MDHLKWHENDTKISFFDDLFTIWASLRRRFQKKHARGTKLRASAKNKEQGEEVRYTRPMSWDAVVWWLIRVARAACTHAWLRASSSRACSRWPTIDEWRVMVTHFVHDFLDSIDMRSLLIPRASWKILRMFLLHGIKAGRMWNFRRTQPKLSDAPQWPRLYLSRVWSKQIGVRKKCKNVRWQYVLQ